MFTRSRRLLTVTAAGIGSLALLVGCAGGNSHSNTQSGSDRLDVVMYQPPRSGLSPFSDDVFKLSRWNTAETLLKLDGQGELQPFLATEWSQMPGTDAVRLTLRDDVKFHDGSPFNAEAVVNTVSKAMSATPGPRVLDGVQLSAEAVSEFEVEITTDVPDPLLTARLASPQMSILSAAAYVDDQTVDPIGTGTGPFKLVNVDGTSKATLDRFDDYWGDVAKIDGIDVSFVPDGTARAAALRSGSADIVETVPVSQASLLDESQIHEIEMPRTNALYLNNASGIFADQAMRAAARQAIDGQVIADSTYEGRAAAAIGLVGPAIPGAAELRGDTSSSVTPAKVDGQVVSLATYSDRAELPEVAVQLEEQLEAAGFVVEQDVREYASMEADMFAGTFDMVILSRSITLDTGDVLTWMVSDFSCDGGFNVAHVCDPEIDALMSRSQQLPPGQERLKATMGVEALILSKDVVVPLVHERIIQGEAGTFQNLERDPSERALVTTDTVPAD